MVAPTSTQTIQCVPGLTFRQANRRKRPKLNSYVPPSTSQSRDVVHTSARFAGLRDGNMRVSTRHLITHSLPSSQAVPPEEGTEFDFTAFDGPSMSIEDETLPPKRKRTAGVSSLHSHVIISCSLSGQDNPLLIWIGERHTYLSEIIRLDGRGENVEDTCPGACCTDPGRFRCRDCDDLQLYCATCTLANHARSPTHRIQVHNIIDKNANILTCVQEWNGMFLKVTSLKTLGLRVQLGHPIGQRCILPQQAFNDDFVLIDTNGIHEIGLDFCSCETSQTHVKQLLRHGWFPATSTDPRTAATFRLLHHYQILSFESKASAYEFYHSLVRLTDNTGLTKRKVCLYLPTILKVSYNVS